LINNTIISINIYIPYYYLPNHNLNKKFRLTNGSNYGQLSKFKIILKVFYDIRSSPDPDVKNRLDSMIL